jgi:hypothetical protein
VPQCGLDAEWQQREDLDPYYSEAQVAVVVEAPVWYRHHGNKKCCPDNMPVVVAEGEMDAPPNDIPMTQTEPVSSSDDTVNDEAGDDEYVPLEDHSCCCEGRYEENGWGNFDLGTNRSVVPVVCGQPKTDADADAAAKSDLVEKVGVVHLELAWVDAIDRRDHE